MKIKLDENLPAELAELLVGKKHDVHTVPGEFLVGRDDAKIFEAAVSEGRMLMTQDLDFSDVRKFKPGSHCGIVLIRLRHPSRQYSGLHIQPLAGGKGNGGFDQIVRMVRHRRCCNTTSNR